MKGVLVYVCCYQALLVREDKWLILRFWKVLLALQKFRYYRHLSKESSYQIHYRHNSFSKSILILFLWNLDGGGRVASTAESRGWRDGSKRILLLVP